MTKLNPHAITGYVAFVAVVTLVLTLLPVPVKADVTLTEMQALTPGVSECVVPPDYWNGSPSCWNGTTNSWSARATILETAGLTYGQAAKFVRSIARNGYDFTVTIDSQSEFTAAILGPIGSRLTPVDGPLVGASITCDALQKSFYFGGDPTQTSSYRRVRVAECPDLDNFVVQILPF